MLALLDTHALIWYLYDDPRLSKKARDMLEKAASSSDQIACSALTLAEILYLQEKERIPSETFNRLVEALETRNSLLVVAPVTLAVVIAMQNIPRTEVPDLPDRVIAATALHLGVPLISRDRKIAVSRVSTIW
jgi:PIN domain nuclease of toxin-antitoxin system